MSGYPPTTYPPNIYHLYHAYDGPLVTFLSIMIVLPTIAIGLRLLARGKSNAKYALDDWLAVVALIFFYAFQASLLWGNALGLYESGEILTIMNRRCWCRRIWLWSDNTSSADSWGLSWSKLCFPPHRKSRSLTVYVLQSVYVVAIFSVPTISFAKLSLLALYWRIFSKDTRFRILLYVTTASCIAWMVACLFATVLKCVPISAAWDVLERGNCINFNLFFIIIEPINVVLDLVIILLPLFFIKELQLKTRMKVTLGIIFLLGGL